MARAPSIPATVEEGEFAPYDTTVSHVTAHTFFIETPRPIQFGGPIVVLIDGATIVGEVAFASIEGAVITFDADDEAGAKLHELRAMLSPTALERSLSSAAAPPTRANDGDPTTSIDATRAEELGELTMSDAKLGVEEQGMVLDPSIALAAAVDDLDLDDLDDEPTIERAPWDAAGESEPAQIPDDVLDSVPAGQSTYPAADTLPPPAEFPTLDPRTRRVLFPTSEMFLSQYASNLIHGGLVVLCGPLPMGQQLPLDLEVDGTGARASVSGKVSYVYDGRVGFAIDALRDAKPLLDAMARAVGGMAV